MNSHGLNLKSTIIKKKGDVVLGSYESEPLVNNSEIQVGDKKFPFRSYNKNLLNCMQSAMLATGGISAEDTSGTTRSTQVNSWTSILGDDSTNSGLVVGTGTTAVALTDYELDTPIADGSSAGQLEYNSTGWDTLYLDSGSSTYLTITRSIDNNSGGTIGINEVGLKLQYQSTGYKFLFTRDVLGSTVNINDTETKTIKVKLENSYNTTEGWNRNLIRSFSEFFKGSASPLYDTSGTLRSSTYTWYGAGSFAAYAVAGDATKGIRVGTGTGSFSPSGYTLSSPISHGTSTGQLVYGACSTSNGLYEAINIEGNTIKYRFGRNFLNNSGGTITINEFDIVVFAAHNFQIYRKKLTTPITLLDGENVDIIVEMSTSV